MATIRDVATRSGVSTATVSYVLNNGPRTVRPRTQARVLAAMRELNYHPSAMARGLNHKRVNSIGVVTLHSVQSPLENPYYRPVLSGIVDAATRLRQSVNLFNGNVWESESSDFPVFCDGRCDGLLIFLPYVGNTLIPALKNQTAPFVIIGEGGTDPTVSSIDIDNVAVAREIVGHLIGFGHRRIAHFQGADYLLSSADRRLGYTEALAAAGIPFDPALVLTGDYETPSGYDLARTLFETAGEKPTAIFAANDRMAVGAIKALRELGLDVPRDVSVAGIDCSSHPDIPGTRLTSGDQHLMQLGETAVTMVMELINSAEPRIIKTLQPYDIVPGDTVGPPLIRA
ncbi:MAG: LacI family DNA-binding transcriptional regulator [Capsulimonadaceae bacterium]|nr:LacI family DNA-binding transcriptional regulator [Capsulimonadaceae bacterium]